MYSRNSPGAARKSYWHHAESPGSNYAQTAKNIKMLPIDQAQQRLKTPPPPSKSQSMLSRLSRSFYDLTSNINPASRTKTPTMSGGQSEKGKGETRNNVAVRESSQDLDWTMAPNNSAMNSAWKARTASTHSLHSLHSMGGGGQDMNRTNGNYHSSQRQMNSSTNPRQYNRQVSNSTIDRSLEEAFNVLDTVMISNSNGATGSMPKSVAHHSANTGSSRGGLQRSSNVFRSIEFDHNVEPESPTRINQQQMNSGQVGLIRPRPSYPATSTTPTSAMVVQNPTHSSHSYGHNR